MRSHSQGSKKMSCCAKLNPAMKNRIVQVYICNDNDESNLEVKYSVIVSIIMVTLEPVDISSCWTFEHERFIIIVYPGKGGSECAENK